MSSTVGASAATPAGAAPPVRVFGGSAEDADASCGDGADGPAEEVERASAVAARAARRARRRRTPRTIATATLVSTSPAATIVVARSAIHNHPGTGSSAVTPIADAGAATAISVSARAPDAAPVRVSRCVPPRASVGTGMTAATSPWLPAVSGPTETRPLSSVATTCSPGANPWPVKAREVPASTVALSTPTRTSPTPAGTSPAPSAAAEPEEPVDPEDPEGAGAANLIGVKVSLFAFFTPWAPSAGSITGLDSDGFRLTPDFEGVLLDSSVVSNQTTTCTAPSKAGSWPAEFVETLAADPAGASVSSHFYSTGCGGNQDLKPALPVDVAFSLASTTHEEPEEPEAGSGDIVVEVPEAVQPETGSFAWAWATESAVDLGTASASGANFVAEGSLNDVVVTDTRAGGSGSYSWSISGQVSDFAAGGNTFAGGYLGWTPKVVSGTATAGAAVTSTHLGDTGLGATSVLASSTAATSATVGADLELVIPGTTAAGDYAATLTITAVQ